MMTPRAFTFFIVNHFSPIVIGELVPRGIYYTLHNKWTYYLSRDDLLCIPAGFPKWASVTPDTRPRFDYCSIIYYHSRQAIGIIWRRRGQVLQNLLVVNMIGLDGVEPPITLQE